MGTKSGVGALEASRRVVVNPTSPVLPFGWLKGPSMAIAGPEFKDQDPHKGWTG